MHNYKTRWRNPTTVAITYTFLSYLSLTVSASTLDIDESASLTPTQLVELVLMRNPDIPAMQAALTAAQSRIEKAQSFDDPIVSYGIAPQTVQSNDMNVGQKISLSQTFPWPGKFKIRADAARSAADAAREDIDIVRLRLTEESQLAFADWYFVDAAIRINEVNKSLLKELVNVAQIKYSAGRASQQDALRAELEHARLEHQSIVLERQRHEVRATLNTLLQRLPDARLPPPAKFDAFDSLPQTVSLSDSELADHPELRLLNARIREGQQRAVLAQREFYPDFRIAAEYNSLWMAKEQRYTVGVGINIPLQARRRAASDEAHADLIRLNLARQTRIFELLGEARKAVAQLRETEHILSLFEDRILPLAEESLSAARTDYDSGRGEFASMINTEKNLMEARFQFEQARADYYRRTARLERALGGSMNFESAETGEKKNEPDLH